MNNQNEHYPLAPERRAEILGSLREHGLTTMDGVLCWTDNATGEVISVDLEFFWACGIDLRLHIDPTTTEHAEESTRKALETLAAWCKQRELNDRIRDDTRGKFVFLDIDRKPPKINIADIDYSTLSRLCALSAYIEYSNKISKKHKGKNNSHKEVTKGTEETVEAEQLAGENIKKDKRKNIIMRASRRGRAKATQKDIRKILNLPTKTWRKFWEECETKGYITGNDDEGYQLIDIF